MRDLKGFEEMEKVLEGGSGIDGCDCSQGCLEGLIGVYHNRMNNKTSCNV